MSTAFGILIYKEINKDIRFKSSKDIWNQISRIIQMYSLFYSDKINVFTYHV